MVEQIIDHSKGLAPFYHHEDARLTEGVSYCVSTDILYWVDIYQAQIHRIHNLHKTPDHHDQVTISKENYDSSIFNVPYPIEYPGYKESIGVIFPNDTVETSHLIYFASKFGIGQYDYKLEKWCYMVLYQDCSKVSSYSHKLRSNDGNVSPDGKYLFVGLMEDFMYDPGNSNLGCVLKINPFEKSIDVVIDGLQIPNAFHWNQNGDKMYVTDSLKHTIWEYQYDPNTNTLNGERSPFIDFKANNPDFESPEPDGSDIDLTHNQLFVSVWSSSQIQIFDLITGNLKQRLLLPLKTPRISCCSLVGNDIFITTANQNVTDKEQQETDKPDKNGGCLYKVANVTTGKPLTSSKRTLVVPSN